MASRVFGVNSDLKPSNILVSRSGTAKLCDFGVSTFTDHTCDTLKEVQGTPAFMAPECFEEAVRGTVLLPWEVLHGFVLTQASVYVGVLWKGR